VLASCLLGAACGEADVGESPSTSERARADGEPDCGGGQPWAAEPGIDLDAPGAATAEAALRPFLAPWRELFGGEVAMVDENRAALDGAEIVVAYTTRTNPGGFAVTGSTGCDGYEPEVLPGLPSPDNFSPATAPPVTWSSSTVEPSRATNPASTWNRPPPTSDDSALVPRPRRPVRARHGPPRRACPAPGPAWA